MKMWWVSAEPAGVKLHGIYKLCSSDYIYRLLGPYTCGCNAAGAD